MSINTLVLDSWFITLFFLPFPPNFSWFPPRRSSIRPTTSSLNIQWSKRKCVIVISSIHLSVQAERAADPERAAAQSVLVYLDRTSLPSLVNTGCWGVTAVGLWGFPGYVRIVFTRPWNRGGAGVLSVTLDCGVSLGRQVCVTACGFEEPWQARRGGGWDWMFTFCSAGTKVFRANNCTACKRDTKTGTFPLFNRLGDPGTHCWGCIQHKAGDSTITPACLFPTPAVLFSTRQHSRIPRTICIQDVQCFPRLPVSQPLPFCRVLSVKLGTKGIWGPAAWLLPPVLTVGEWKHDCSVSELIAGHSCPRGCAGLLYPGETVARAVGMGRCAMWRLILCQAKQLGLVHWIKQTVTRLLGTVWLLYGRWHTGYNGLKKYSEWGKCHS